MNYLAAVPRWLRAHPLAFDALLAAAVLACILIGSVYPKSSAHSPPPADLRSVDVIFAVAACASLVLRRRAPRTVLALAAGFTIAHAVSAAGDPRSFIVMSVVVALYTVASRTDRHTTWRLTVVTVGVLTAAVMLFGDRPWYADENLGVFAWTGMAAGVGDAMRSRRAFVDAIRERAERAERTREVEARRRVAEERMRIARELHDVVAHHIALVNVQAGVASHVMESRPDQAKEALAHVREASRTALEELRSTVGLLRHSDDPEAPTEPAPGLGVLDQLIDDFVRAGLSVSVEAASLATAATAATATTVGGGRTGAGGTAATTEPARAGEVTGALPAAVDLTAYRVLQEALTNVRKHAGPGARARARIVRQPDALELTVLDDDRGAADGGPDGDGLPAGGHGLVGMRERTAALGGSCTAGARTDGHDGFEVRVRLPLQVPADKAAR